MAKVEVLTTKPEYFEARLSQIQEERKQAKQRQRRILSTQEELTRGNIHRFWELPKPQQTALRLRRDADKMQASRNPTLKNLAKVIGQILETDLFREALPSAVMDNLPDHVLERSFHVTKWGAICNIAMGTDGSYTILFSPPFRSRLKTNLHDIFAKVEKLEDVKLRSDLIGFMIKPEPSGGGHQVNPFVVGYTEESPYHNIFLPISRWNTKAIVDHVNDVLGSGTLHLPSFVGNSEYQIKI